MMSLSIRTRDQTGVGLLETALHVFHVADQLPEDFGEGGGGTLGIHQPLGFAGFLGDFAFFVRLALGLLNVGPGRLLVAVLADKASSIWTVASRTFRLHL